MLFHSIFTLSALTAAVFAQSSQSQGDDFNAQCISMCFAVKSNQAGYLAPECNPSDLLCLCQSDAYIKAYSHCLWDNCADDSQSQAGIALFDEICSNAGAAIGSYTAQTGAAAKQTAVLQVESLLNAPFSGSGPAPMPSFQAASAYSALSVAQVTEAALATSSAVAAYSRAQQLASLSLNHEIGVYSASIAEDETAASESAGQLSGSAYAQATAAIASSLTMVRVAASSKLDADRAQAEASLSQLSQAAGLGPATPTSNVVNAHSSAMRTQIQAGLGLLAMLAGLSLI